VCLYPRLIRNRKYTVTEKNGGDVPIAKDQRVLSVPVGCGKCMECRKQKSMNWQVRLAEDIRINTNAKFLTFTFSDESLQELDDEQHDDIDGYYRDNEILSLAVRRFLERWRRTFKKSVRHWLVSEIGGKYTERIHLHGLLWTDESLEVIQERWGYGNVILGDGKGEHYVSEQTVNYIVKYISKVDEKHPGYTSKVYTSKGIGANYLVRNDKENNMFKGEETNELYRSKRGVKVALPVYYRNKIYTDDEREDLWLYRLDKEIRYVDGVEVSIKDGLEEYYRLLDHKRRKNKRLGFGDDEKNWEQARYEGERRLLKRLEREERLAEKLNRKTC